MAYIQLLDDNITAHISVCFKLSGPETKTHQF